MRKKNAKMRFGNRRTLKWSRGQCGGGGADFGCCTSCAYPISRCFRSSVLPRHSCIPSELSLILPAPCAGERRRALNGQAAIILSQPNVRRTSFSGQITRPSFSGTSTRHLHPTVTACIESNVSSKRDTHARPSGELAGVKLGNWWRRRQRIVSQAGKEWPSGWSSGVGSSAYGLVGRCTFELLERGRGQTQVHQWAKDGDVGGCQAWRAADRVLAVINPFHYYPAHVYSSTSASQNRTASTKARVDIDKQSSRRLDQTRSNALSYQSSHQSVQLKCYADLKSNADSPEL